MYEVVNVDEFTVVYRFVKGEKKTEIVYNIVSLTDDIPAHTTYSSSAAMELYELGTKLRGCIY